MVVRFTAGPADESDAGQHELAPVISFSASRKAKRGEEHGRARGNHPAGSALDPVDDTAPSTGDGSSTSGVEAVAPVGSRRPSTRHDVATIAPVSASSTPHAGEFSPAPGEERSAGGHLSGSAASGTGPGDIGGESARRAPVASLARKRGGADVSAIDDDMVGELPPSIDDVENAILKKLRRRGLSEAEILAECLALDLTAHQANELLERLRELGYVDDRALAEQLRYSHYERKSQSRQVVARLMSTRKIPAEVIDEVLEDIDSDDELSAAREVAEKRASQMTSLDDATMERRLVGFLARRGYPGGVVRTVVGEIIRGRRSSVRFR
ncbi:regulatory protein RecX [Okibacterium fritillariae]|uniref:Regulatory protein RecX n=1 Tax=Okibacterium fritillariae TaxID=123320 RepID=A0A1T5KM71_9MICO|nr:regulatory protein RecX [Okibacterium fritillariae]SKC64846.1 SOS response regulatory protein OraA/RecX, interacts with RecA [Okibacterium fritillariae]